MSDSARPDLAAFRELEQLIRALGDEMAAWRRRAHEAESRLKANEARLARQTTQPAGVASGATPTAAPAAAAAQPAPSASSSQLVAALQRENQDLRLRLEAARQRTRQLLDRVRFLRQQHEIGSAER